MATNIPRARNVIATTAVVVSSCFYVSYKSHDQRVLTEYDVSNALCALSTVTPTSSIQQQQQSLAAQHIHNLTKYGVTIVKDTLSSSQLDTWNKRTSDKFDNGDNIEWNSGRAYYSVNKRLGSISKKSVYYSDMARIGCNNRCDATDGGGNHIHDTINNDNHDTASSWLGGLWRRRRRKISSKGSTEVDTNTTTTEHTSILSLQDVVQTYFNQNGISNYELTDVQFLNAYPHSTNQIWHRDNKFRGLTAIVALKDVRQNGPTELIVGSHEATFSLWNVIIKQRDTLSDKPLLGCIDAGDTILYDARIFHRGRGNNVEEEDRPVLVLRWDCTRTPPPGMGMIVTMCNTYVGCWLYAALFALQQISPSNDK